MLHTSTIDELTYVDEAVMEVEADEAGRDARVGDARVLDDATDDVVGAGARLVVERGAQRRCRTGARRVATGGSSQGEQESAVRGLLPRRRRDARGSRHARALAQLHDADRRSSC